MGAPDSSDSTPLIVPVPGWADAQEINNAAARSHKPICLKLAILPLFFVFTKNLFGTCSYVGIAELKR
jgi:hypothetical protein